ncbi:MAG: head GIN domain-containing protein [Erythrobacter sp.]
MFRLLAACSLGLAALAAVPATQAHPGKEWRSTLDDGERISTSWSSTGRFESVTLASSDDVSVTRGERWSIRASGSPAVLAELRFRVKGDQLIIGRRWQREKVEGTARIEVTAPAVDGVTLAGSGNLSIDTLDAREVNATVAGSGTLEVGRIAARNLKATVAGSGDLRLAGQAGDGHIAIAGSGEVDGHRLRLATANVTIAGSGDARFNADDSVSASIVGSGDAVVTGTTDCTQTRMGSGRLTCSR